MRAVNDRSSEFRTPVFICGDKNNLDGRVVVLRKADEKNLTINFIVTLDQLRLILLRKILIVHFYFMEKRKNTAWDESRK